MPVASSPLRVGPGLLWQVKKPMSFAELSLPARVAAIFPADFSRDLSLSARRFNATRRVIALEMDRSNKAEWNELD